MDCPRCGLANPRAAARCDCGFDLRAPSQTIATERDALIQRSRNELFLWITLAVVISSASVLMLLFGRGTVYVWGGGIGASIMLAVRAHRRWKLAQQAKDED